LKRILGTAKLSSKNQIVIPKVVRILLDVKAGDTIVFVFEDNRIYLEKQGETGDNS